MTVKSPINIMSGGAAGEGMGVANHGFMYRNAATNPFGTGNHGLQYAINGAVPLLEWNPIIDASHQALYNGGYDYREGKYGPGDTPTYSNMFVSANTNYFDASGSSDIMATISDGPFSMGCWMKTPDIPSGFLAFVGTGDATDGTSVRFGPVSGGTIRFRTNNVNKASTTANLDDGDWHFIVITSSGTGGNMTFYIDSVAETPITSQAYDFADSGSLFIGATPGPGLLLDGALDFVTIWNVELDQAQVDGLYSLQHEWNPTLDTDALGYFDSSIESSLTLTGSDVDQLDNQVTGNDFIGTVKPVTGADFNNLNAMTFTTDVDYMSLANATAPEDYVIVQVLDITSTAGEFDSTLSANVNTGGGSNYQIDSGFGATTTWLGRWNGSGISNGNNNWADGPYSGQIMLTAILDPNVSGLRVSRVGGDEKMSEGSTLAPPTDTDIRMNMNRGVFGSPGADHVTFIWSSANLIGNVEKIEGYSSWRCGTTTDTSTGTSLIIDSSHTYKTAPPKRDNGISIVDALTDTGIRLQGVPTL